MQAKLEPSEFAYLLHTLKAEKVVGVNNAQLFPNDATTRAALLKTGFVQLQEHGWLVAEGDGINANAHLMLLTAVVANPSYTISATHYLSAGLSQTLTYYISQGIIVEQFVGSNGDYVLRQMTTIDEMAGRVREVFSPLLAVLPEQSGFIVAADVFEVAMVHAKAGDLSVLQQALLVEDISPAERAMMADIIRQLRPLGRIERAAIADRQLQAWSELVMLRAPTSAVWIVYQDPESNTIEFVPASDHLFFQMLDSLLKSLRVDAI